MGTILTINTLNEFPKKIDTTIVGREENTIEGLKTPAETKFFKSTKKDLIVKNYETFQIEHYQRFSVEGKLGTKEFNTIMRLYKFSVFKPSKNDNYIYTFGGHKADNTHSALSRLSKKTGIKSTPLTVNLIDTVEKILKYAPDIRITSGWFSNLGLTNLNNVLLQGDQVNLGPEWEKFKKTKGAALSNIELLIDDSEFPDGYIKVSLSQRGVIFCRRKLSAEKTLEIANKVQKILNRK
ncbi:hypothetical protein [Lysinibacillus sp. fls2-241-R2A-57]|uniref:hypothetical protein n=1 Tax=Lysinibacillus sp. fls2-241-R2A-57 TaxID=3040292 RepID=UPI00255542C8|nr:hypothetical protein [Lysinibacillus sp. fls2-241-R2A-57]